MTSSSPLPRAPRVARHHGYGRADAAPAPLSVGPIALLPDSDAIDAEPSFAAAVEAGGGVLAPLSDETRGIIWTAADGADELERTLDAHPDISWVQLPWAGVDAFAGVLERFRDDGRTWTSAKGAYAEPVAEHAVALLLAVLRQLPRRARAERWEADEVGRSLFGARVVLIGAGGIAQAFLALVQPFGVHVTVVRRRAEPLAGAARTVGVGNLGDALETADVVLVAAALTTQTRHLLDAEMIERMPQHAVIVNVARGGLIDTDALDAALRAGRLGGAGLDVTDPEPLPEGHPLWSAPNTLITPHVADTVEMTVPLFAERIAQNTAAFVSGGHFVGRIDLAAGY